MTRACAALLLFVLAACVEPWNLEGRKFPCRAAADCIEGHACDPVKFVCVPASEVSAVPRDAAAAPDRGEPAVDAEARPEDAEVPPDADLADSDTPRDTGAEKGDGGEPDRKDASEPDTGRTGAALGERCGAERRCDEGLCVDGVCCESDCRGICMRCDIEPGRCRPIPGGMDPQNECSNQRYQCSDFIAGLDGSTCHRCLPGEVALGTCNGTGDCRPEGCRCQINVTGQDTRISRCGSVSCLRSDACPRFARVELFDQTPELCAVGGMCGTLLAGCCSDTGSCCPAPLCNELDPLCQ